MENTAGLESQATSPIKNLIANSIEGQKPSWKDALSRKFAGIEDVVADLEQENQLEPPPAWFGSLVKKVTDLWFDPKSFENEEMYEKLGIRTFKKYIPTGEVTSKLVWKLTHENAFIGGSSERDLRNFEKFTRIYEAIHLSFLPIVAASIGISLSKGDLGSAAFTAAINILVNVYPILLQRYNRLRLYKAIERAQVRDAGRNQTEVSEE
jgi:hypothetical protein